jgi:hypothetical protein
MRVVHLIVYLPVEWCSVLAVLIILLVCGLARRRACVGFWGNLLNSRLGLTLRGRGSGRTVYCGFWSLHCCLFYENNIIVLGGTLLRRCLFVAIVTVFYDCRGHFFEGKEASPT